LEVLVELGEVKCLERTSDGNDLTGVNGGSDGGSGGEEEGEVGLESGEKGASARKKDLVDLSKVQSGVLDDLTQTLADLTVDGRGEAVET
jgi:hypothetical protein